MSKPLRVHLMDFENEAPADELHTVLRGHLYIEALLDDLLDRSLPEPAFVPALGLMFFKKVKLLRALGHLQGFEELLLEFNSLRNKLAHRVHFAVTREDALLLWKCAECAGIDLPNEGPPPQGVSPPFKSDHVIHELVTELFQHMVFAHQELFPDNEGFDGMG